MSPELRQQAAKAFWLDEEATDDQVQAVLAIAQQKKFRPKFVLGLDIDRRARHLATLGSVPDAIAAVEAAAASGQEPWLLVIAGDPAPSGRPGWEQLVSNPRFSTWRFRKAS